jgi:hypothetical protein
VLEIFPDWDFKKKEVIWVKQKVGPAYDKDMWHFLHEDPFDGIDFFFYDMFNMEKPDRASKLNWENHKFCMCMLVIELYCFITGESVIKKMLEAKKLIFGSQKPYEPEKKSASGGDRVTTKQNCSNCGRSFELSSKEIK